jgi:hypothetical protein
MATSAPRRKNKIPPPKDYGAGPTKVVPLDEPLTEAKARCPQCGRLVDSLRCGHCGSQIPSWQADLYGTTIKKLAKLGGNRVGTGNQGGISKDNPAASVGRLSLEGVGRNT